MSVKVPGFDIVPGEASTLNELSTIVSGLSDAIKSKVLDVVLVAEAPVNCICPKLARFVSLHVTKHNAGLSIIASAAVYQSVRDQFEQRR